MKKIHLEKIRAKLFGFALYYPATGLGGNYARTDQFHLIWKARVYAINAWFIKVASVVNNIMTDWLASKIVGILNNCVLLATGQSRIEYSLFKANSKLIIDCRGRYQGSADNIVKA